MKTELYYLSYPNNTLLESQTRKELTCGGHHALCLKGKGHQGVFSLVKDTSMSKFLLEKS